MTSVEQDMETTMRARTLRAGLVLGLMLGGGSGAALAQAATGDDSAALGGPKVGTPAPSTVTSTATHEMMDTPPTIVQRDFMGAVKVIEDERPEIAAVRALTLDEATRAKVDAVVKARGELVSRLTLEHYGEFVKLANAFQGATVAQRRDGMRTFRETFGELLNPPLIDTLAKELPADKAVEMRDMVREYREAVPAVPARGAGEQGEAMDEQVAEDVEADQPRERGLRGRVRERIARAGVERGSELRETAKEMGRAFKAFVDEKQSRYQAMLDNIEATPEQRAKIDAIINRDGQAAALRPTPEQASSRFREIFAVLTPAQRRTLAQEYAGEGR